jgi:hypothetical protein
MQLILNRYATSVNELTLKLDTQGWIKLVEIVEGLQEEGECLELDISSKDAFIDSLNENEDMLGSLYERVLEEGAGKEHRYVDPTNESYGVSVEK